tara:strand:+ start:223 stop:411 length:189 start_codon:yes stop_codon:yes gene_type:complete
MFSTLFTDKQLIRACADYGICDLSGCDSWGKIPEDNLYEAFCELFQNDEIQAMELIRKYKND